VLQNYYKIYPLATYALRIKDQPSQSFIFLHESVKREKHEWILV